MCSSNRLNSAPGTIERSSLSPLTSTIDVELRSTDFVQRAEDVGDGALLAGIEAYHYQVFRTAPVLHCQLVVIDSASSTGRAAHSVLDHRWTGAGEITIPRNIGKLVSTQWQLARMALSVTH